MAESLIGAIDSRLPDEAALLCYDLNGLAIEHEKCRQIAVDLLCDYLEGDLPEPVAREVERHLVECPPCAVLLNTYRMTTEIGREALRADIPAECERALLEFLDRHLPS